MANIRFRIAKPSDAKQISNAHWHVRDRYTKGIFLSLGKHFLNAYYEVLLDDPNEIIVCAEREDGKIVGFCSATLDAEAQAMNIRNHKIKLGFAAIGALIRKPSLIKDIWQRYASLCDKNAKQFVKTDGVRSEYVCWLKDEGDTIKYVTMERAKTNILYDLGVREYYFEVDKHNEKLMQYHMRVSKAIVVEEISLPDGRERVLFKRILTKR